MMQVEILPILLILVIVILVNEFHDVEGFLPSTTPSRHTTFPPASGTTQGHGQCKKNPVVRYVASSSSPPEGAKKKKKTTNPSSVAAATSFRIKSYGNPNEVLPYNRDTAAAIQQQQQRHNDRRKKGHDIVGNIGNIHPSKQQTPPTKKLNSYYEAGGKHHHQHHRRGNINSHKKYNSNNRNNEKDQRYDLAFCERIENQMALALHSIRQIDHHQSTNRVNDNEKPASAAAAAATTTTTVAPATATTDTTTTAPPVAWDVLLFPTVRECNRALAVLGDIDLLRALRLFGKMRQAARHGHGQHNIGSSSHSSSTSSTTNPAAIQSHRYQHHGIRNAQQQPPRAAIVPAPTLVTYSTLMSRAVNAHKPRVALRLWKLMLSSSSLSSPPPPTTSSASPSSTQYATSSSTATPYDNRRNHHHNKNNAAPSTTTTTGTMIYPDVRAANILMNCYAKLAMVECAQDLLHQMYTGCGPDIRKPLQPNIVTYNTVLDACLKAGDLDAALRTKQDMEDAGVIPDARTYTNLIATVARQPSISAGRNDPTLAFMLLQEMKDKYNLKPNGMTYSALIDAAGRCKRSDMALQGLRMMMRQKNSQDSSSSASPTAASANNNDNHLENEVGAWTAAIKACGSAGGLDTAIRLFYGMSNYGVKPNTVTCGCLTDLLLKAGRTADTLKVLRYMKAESIEPSEVMYTSLMTRAERLVQLENKFTINTQQQQYPHGDGGHDQPSKDKDQTKNRDGTKKESSDTATAIEVYSELMKSIVDAGRTRKLLSRHNNAVISAADVAAASDDSHTLLLKVFLVFQEMKAAGAQPDLACFNALLRACARVGDVARAQSVLDQILEAGFDPNDTSWRQLLQTASKARRSDLAESIWNYGLTYRSNRRKVDERLIKWKPSVEAFSALLTSYLRQASSGDVSDDEKLKCYSNCLELYENLLSGDEDSGMDRVDLNQVLDNQRTMLLIVQAIVGLYDGSINDKTKQQELSNMAKSILQLHCFHNIEMNRLHFASARAYLMASRWTRDNNGATIATR